MLKHKAVRGILMHNNITTLSDLDQIQIVYGGTGGTLYFYDVEGDYVYATWNTTTPVIIDSNTTGITVSPATVTLYNSGSTQQITVTNQNSDDVTFECTFTGYDTSLVTASTSGLLTATSTPGLSGSTTVTVTHPDIPTLTGASVVTVSRTTLSLTVTGNTPINAYTTTSGSITVTDQRDVDVTSDCTFVSSDTGVATVGSSTGTITPVHSGTTTITATHVDWATGSTDIVITGWVVTGCTISPTGGTHVTGSTFAVAVLDQEGNNMTEYSTELTGQTAYIVSYAPSTGNVRLTDDAPTGTTSIYFGSSVYDVYGEYEITILG